MLGEDIVVKNKQEPMEDRRTKLASIERQVRAIRSSRPDLFNQPLSEKYEFLDHIQIDVWSMSFDQLLEQAEKKKLSEQQKKKMLQDGPYRELVVRKKDLDGSHILTLVFRKFEDEFGRPTGITDEIVYFRPNSTTPQTMILFHIDAQRGSVTPWKGNYDEEKVSDESLGEISKDLQSIQECMEFVHPPRRSSTRR